MRFSEQDGLNSYITGYACEALAVELQESGECAELPIRQPPLFTETYWYVYDCICTAASDEVWL